MQLLTYFGDVGGPGEPGGNPTQTVTQAQDQHKSEMSQNTAMCWSSDMSIVSTVGKKALMYHRSMLNLNSKFKTRSFLTDYFLLNFLLQTWIGNRRRKYRLMGIDIPPPKGGPATFPKLASADLSSPLTSEGDKPVELPQDSEQNDAVSLCLSEGLRNLCNSVFSFQ